MADRLAACCAARSGLCVKERPPWYPCIEALRLPALRLLLIHHSRYLLEPVLVQLLTVLLPPLRKSGHTGTGITVQLPQLPQALDHPTLGCLCLL